MFLTSGRMFDQPNVQAVLRQQRVRAAAVRAAALRRQPDRGRRVGPPRPVRFLLYYYLNYYYYYYY